MSNKLNDGGWSTVLDKTEYTRWLQTADGNLESAKREADAAAHHVAVFLAEQAAQCSTKAVLHGVGATAKAYGHGLVALGEAVTTEIGVAVPDAVRDATQRLAQSYMPSRYPDALPSGSPVDHYGPSHSTQAIADADAVMSLMRKAWDALLEAEEAGGASDHEEGPDDDRRGVA